MRLEFIPHDDAEYGYVPPILDLHDRWLVAPRLAPPDAQGVVMVLRPRQILNLHERRDADFIMWARSHPDFRVVNPSNHPEFYRG